MSDKMFCKNCGYIGDPKVHTPGYFAVELILWCMFFIPGLAYTLWRTANRTTICPQCRQINMIPADSPMAQGMIKQMRNTLENPQPAAPSNPYQKLTPKPKIEIQDRDEQGRYIIPD
jgi:hypothetical protein